MKNGEMKQNKKLLEDIAGIAGNCLIVFPSQEGGILRQCPQESPLANGQTLIDGQVLIKLMAGSKTNRRVQVVDGDAHVSLKGVRAERKGYSMTRGSWICSVYQDQECQVKMKNGEMKQNKKLLEDIAGIAGNCLIVCPSQEGGILRQCPQESPLANGHTLIDGQVLIRLMAGSKTNRRVQVVDGDAHVSVFGDILIQEGVNKGCVESLSSSDGWMAAEPLGGGSFHGVSWRDRGLHTQEQRESMIFRYFIVDVVDPGSTPDVARCGRELGEQFLSHEQG
ncbi:hypothetical protein F2Q70_00027093 [Brassica cretica]|uniref:Uncharacterized protein n=1 Tax=Brassica cretica TaxID=69181 RepID=A0A8S9L6Y8_BRACR|nr:hypothetical protein F2Q70_00027093 [Brassica cretica]